MSGSDKSEQNFQESVASVDQYRLEFAPVLRSYNAMETTKRRHFDYLSMLENKKKKFNLSATAEEELTLGNLPPVIKAARQTPATSEITTLHT